MTATAPVNLPVRQASTETLLDTMCALTHRIHAATVKSAAADLRAQRQVVRDELLRRAGGR